MSKLKVLDKKSEKSINSEREFLSKLHNPFIVNMHYAFQDAENLYLVMDLMPGGDLRFHISRHKKFSEEQTRFFICGIIIALEYIHANNVIHRDIKPENLVLDENGYVRLTDFGIAKENMPDNKSETSGTPGYMSPEVMKALNHSFPVDFFALGVIGYEFMKGERPYVGRNRKEIKEQILAKQAEIKPEEINEGWSKESADFINKLLIRKPENRIGYKGINELKVHPWLKYYPWEMLYKKSLPSPFIPENKDNFDRRYCESSEVVTEETKLRYEEILIDDLYKKAFKDFYYNTDEDNKRKNSIIENKPKNKNTNKNSTNRNSHKIIINQNNKNITEINKNNNNNNMNISNNTNINNKKSSSKNKKLKNSMKILPSSTRNIIIKKHKKSGSVINGNKNYNNNINTNVNGNVSNNVIFINFNINDPNLAGNMNNNNQNEPKTDRVIHQYKNSAKNIYCGGNTIHNLNNNNNTLIHKIGINIGNFISPNGSIKKVKKNYGSGDKKIYNNNINKNYLKNSKNKNIRSNNNVNNINSLNSEINKIKNMKNNKNIHNSMKDIYGPKNKTTEIESPDAKKPKESELRENTISLNNPNKDKNSKLREMSHSYSIKDLMNKEKKESELTKDNLNNNNNNINKSNINHYSIKKAFLKHSSPEENNKKNNITNDSSSIPNIIKDKLYKSSRAYINSYNSKREDLSVNKSKTFSNDKQTLKEIKEIFISNKLKNKDSLNCYKNKDKSKNNIMNKKNYFSNDKSNYKKNNINKNSEIDFLHSKNNNSNLDNLNDKDILIKANLNKNQNQNNNITINRTIISIHKRMQQKKNHNESTKLILEKNKKNYITNNKFKFFSPDESKIKKKPLKNKQSKGQINNLSISSIIVKTNKNKEISNSTLNINNYKNNESIKGYMSARNNENNNEIRKSMAGNKENNKNIILSYKQKQIRK